MKMSSRDDETLPISGYSEEYSTDVTVDEDFIPTSQPHSSLSCKVTKSEFSSYSLKLSQEVSTQPLSGFVDDTLPPDALIQETQDKSADFIPDTETKKRKIYYSDVIACKRKIPIFETEGVFSSPQENLKALESSTLELQANCTFGDSIMTMDTPNVKVGEGSVTEILVNDSTETVELGDTPVSIKEVRGLEKSESCGSFNLDQCEDTQIFDSCVLPVSQSSPPNVNKVKCQDLSLNEVADGDLQLESKANLKAAAVPEQTVETKKQNGDFFLKEEPLFSTTSKGADNDSPSAIIKRNVDIKLTVSCLITVNVLTKKIIGKEIQNVNEKPKPKTSPAYNELLTDCTSDKSKRCSTSSSESVYSDKSGLPFPLPKRVSAVYDQNCASDSSEDNLAKFIYAQKNCDRVPWGNEHLLAVKIDEIIKRMIENQELINRPSTQPPRKSKKRVSRSDLNLLELISENSSSSQILKSETDESQAEKVIGAHLDTTKDSNPTSQPDEAKPQEETVEENAKNDTLEHVDDENRQERLSNPEREKSQEAKDVRLCDGLRIFARWTDKQYYSGVLSGQSKNDKWDVFFDDGTVKAIKEDFIMPAAWLKTGALVFVLVNDNYESGQITDVKRDENTTYVVQLDNTKEELTVELSDMRLSDDLASIIRENYQPLNVESPQRKADITCDNVLTGKRLRECRTPLKVPSMTRIENSASKKKPASKAKDLEGIKGTPRKKKNDRKAGLKAENGHLVEDKIPSSESPSGNETGETPFRSSKKEARGKAKPRSLTYEQEERQKRKQKNWLTADGTPIPGPSGVKFRKKKAEESTPVERNFEETESDSSQQVEGNKRKRKAVDSGKEEGLKYSVTEARSTRSRRK